MANARELLKTKELKRLIPVTFVSVLLVFSSVLIPQIAYSTPQLENLWYGYPVPFIRVNAVTVGETVLGSGEVPNLLFTPRSVPFFTNFPHHLRHWPYEFHAGRFLVSVLVITALLAAGRAGLRWAATVGTARD